MAVMIIPVGSPYFKKEDASDFFNNRKKGVIIVGIAYTLVSALIPYFIGKSVNENFASQFNAGESLLFSLAPIVSIIGLICYWVFSFKVFSSQYKDDFFSKVAKYKDSEMINITKVIDSKDMWLPVVLYIISLMITLFLLMYPVFLVEGRY